MRPFAWAGLGFVLLALVVNAGGFDLLPDWLGWLLVLFGVWLLPSTFPLRDLLLYLGVLALATSVVLWVPDVLQALDDADDSLAWAVNLPHLVFTALLCLATAQAADLGDQRRAGAWWRTLATVAVIVTVLPVLIFGGGLDGLAGPAALLVALVSLVLPVTMLVHANRPWVAARPG